MTNHLYLIEKLKQYGAKWFVRRLMRELIHPTTRLRQYIKPFAPFFYYGFHKPIGRILSQCKKTDTARDTLYFFYDFDVEPITYDFIWALSTANARREELDLTSLTVVFVPGTEKKLRKEHPDYEQAVSYDSRIWRIYSILLPSVKLLSCPHSILFCATRQEALNIQKTQAHYVFPTYYHVSIPIPYPEEDAAIYKNKVMALSADKQAKQYVMDWINQRLGGLNSRKLIVITLRQYGYTRERNSNIKEWTDFARSLNTQQYAVVFISDTEEANKMPPNELNTFLFFNEACWNIHLRAAIYEIAYLNLGVNNGPMALCWFNAKCRYIIFKIAIPNHPKLPLHMLTDRGFLPNKNAPFAGPFQKWVWETDSFDVISREFNVMVRCLTTVLQPRLHITDEEGVRG